MDYNVFFLSIPHYTYVYCNYLEVSGEIFVAFSFLNEFVYF